MKRTLIIFLMLQVTAVVCFLYFAHQADVVLGKDGIGDIQESNTFNKYAGFAFYSECILWLLAVAGSLINKQFKSMEGQLAVGVPPLVIVIGWVSLWFI
jgi:hypothetical protein